jgi:hypothetical protein
LTPITANGILHQLSANKTLTNIQRIKNIGFYSIIIKPAIKYPTVVIPAKAGIQAAIGCRIKFGMTEFSLFCRRVNNLAALKRV